jgi:uncharacterized protein (TIGR02284 family)
MDNKKIVSTLNDLIETCRDGLNGFKEAAENVKGPDLKTLFTQISNERAKFVQELQLEVRRLGGEAEKTGSTAGALHRVWMDVKGTLTGKDDHTILVECERGEDSAVDAYKAALKLGLPTDILTIVQQQYQVIQRDHDRIKQMRDSKAATSGR